MPKNTGGTPILKSYLKPSKQFTGLLSMVTKTGAGFKFIF
jgi:hypothetical protein